MLLFIDKDKVNRVYLYKLWPLPVGSFSQGYLYGQEPQTRNECGVVFDSCAVFMNVQTEGF